MLYELKSVTYAEEAALTAAIEEIQDKDKTTLPEAFEPMGNLKVCYSQFIGRFKVTEYANCCEDCYVYACNNTKAVIGLVSIRKYFSPTCDERMRLGDVDLCVRPSHRGFGMGRKLFDEVMKQCVQSGVTEPLIVVPKRFDQLVHMISKFDHNELEPVTNYDIECRRFRLRLPALEINNE